MRQIMLDTETTGLEVSQGHRIIEIGAVELVERRRSGRDFHCFINPDREVDMGALEVHGISNDFLRDKPRFDEIADDFLDFVSDAEIIIHNAAFDVGFIDSELRIAGREPAALADYSVEITDTLRLAREMHPGQSNSLDALCRRYEIDNSNRTLHGALLDAELLAEVYLALTGGQESLGLSVNESAMRRRLPKNFGDRIPPPVLGASADELAAHQERLEAIAQASDGDCVWLRSKEEVVDA